VRPRVLPLLLIALAAAAARGDRVILGNGQELSGEVVEEAGDSILLRMPNGTMRIARSRIREVVRETPAAYLRREAASRLAAGDARTAVQLLEKALALDAEDAALPGLLVEALLRHAGREREERRRPAAERLLERAEALAPDEPRIDGLREAIARDEAEAARLHDEAIALFSAGDGIEALRRMNAWRLLMPAGDPDAKEAMAAGHLAVGRTLAGKGDLRAALDHLRAARSFGRADEADRDLRVLAPIAALEAAGAGDLAGARRFVDGLSGYGDPAVRPFLAAVIDHLSGRVEEAVRGYAEAARAAEGRSGDSRGAIPYEEVRRWAAATLRDAIAHPPVEGARRWRETFLAPLESAHAAWFVVHAPTRALAEAAGRAADEAFERWARELLGGLPPKARAEIVIHADRRAYLAADPAPPGTPLRGAVLSREETGGVTYATLGEGGEPLLRIESWADAPGLLEDTLPHEAVHAVQRRGFRAFRRAHWLDEGLAMLGESDRNRDDRRAFLLRAAEMLPLPELLALRSTPPGRGALFYAQACALTAYLRSLGSESQWKSFLDALATRDLGEACRAAYGIESIEELERRFLASLRGA